MNKQRAESIIKAGGASWKGYTFWNNSIWNMDFNNPKARLVNPEQNIADAARLMIDARISIAYDDIDPDDKIVIARRRATVFSNQFEFEQDRLTATMKAICDCAEQIGKGLGE